MNLIASVLNRHYLAHVGECTRIDKIDPLSFKDNYKKRWKAQPSVRSVTLKNERSVITDLYGYAVELRYLTQAHLPVFEKLAANTQKYVGREDSRDALTAHEWEAVYKHVTHWVEGVEDEAEKANRQFVRDFILIGANTGFRFGEMRKLKWSMIQVYEENGRRNVRIMVPPDTKTRAWPRDRPNLDRPAAATHATLAPVQRSTVFSREDVFARSRPRKRLEPC